jgi:replicative DNA helicase
MNEDLKRAEEVVIGSALVDGNMRDRIFEVLSGEDFAFSHCKVIFEAIDWLEEHRERVTPDRVYTRMQRAGTVNDLGQSPARVVADLADLAGGTYGGAEGEYYAKQVKEAATRRRLSFAFTEGLRRIEQGAEPTADILAEFEDRILSIGASIADTRDGAAKSMARLASEFLTRLSEPHSPDTSPFIRSGFEGLDNLIGGFRPGRLYVVAARPGIGKSAFLLRVLIHAAQRENPTLLYSLEMSAEEIIERAHAIEAGVPLSALTGTTPLTDSHIERIGRMEVFAPGWVCDRGSMTSAKLGNTARGMIRRNGVKLVAVDYLQLLAQTDRRGTRNDEVGQDARRLKQLAMDCKVPVIAAAQVNRGVGENDEPLLQHLRDSGEIEQSADAVIFLWNEGAASGYDQTINVSVAKQRNGPTGKLRLTFRREITRYENYSVPS